MELIEIIELIVGIRIIPIGIIRMLGILAWPAFPGNYVSRFFGINRILESNLIILIIPIRIIQSLRINAIKSKNSY